MSGYNQEAVMNQSALTTFHFNSNQVRTTIDDVQNPWFIAKDVCSVLGIQWTGHSLNSIKSEWKGVVNYTTPKGNQNLTIINEPALYKLTFRSRKHEAERFIDWIAEEVLPSIRKTGSYAYNKQKESNLKSELENYKLLSKKTKQAKEEINLLSKIDRMSPGTGRDEAIKIYESLTGRPFPELNTTPSLPRVETDKSKDAMDIAINWISANESLIKDRTYGIWKRGEYVGIHTKHIDDLLKDHGFSPLNIKRAWYKKGWIKKEGAKTFQCYRKIRIDNGSIHSRGLIIIPVYIFKQGRIT